MSTGNMGFVVVRLLAVLLLAPVCAVAAPPASPAASPAPAAVRPSFEVTLSEALLGALLSSVMPYQTEMEQEIGAFGLAKTVRVDVTLSNPRTKVTPQGVKVTLDYVLKSETSVLNRSGTAVPTLTLTPVPERKVIEGRLVRSGVMLPGGIELPIEDLVEPIEIPAVIPQEIEAGEKTVAAEARLTEVILEEGRVRVRGEAAFTPVKATAPAPAR